MLAAERLRANDGQWRAYNSTGNCVILAGPGSGKTRTITVKLARMLAEDIHAPRGIACITYSIQCARALKRRLAALAVEEGNRISIGTVHSFCLRHIIMPFGPLTSSSINFPIAVASTKEVEQLHQEALGRVIGDQRWDPRFDAYRRTHLDRELPEWLEDDEEAAQVIMMYESLLADRQLIDFDGMVLLGLRLVETHAWIRKAIAARFPVLVVDEYQDLGYALDRMVQSLCFGAGIRLLAVGDPDQSIYGFTGAEPMLLKRLSEREDVEPVRLRLNYRCGAEIIRASEAALGETRECESTQDEPGAIFFHERPAGSVDQAGFIYKTIIPEALARRSGRVLGDIAVLYLDRNDGDVVADEIGKHGLQYMRIDGNNPYQPSPVTYWLEDCAAWCARAWRTGDIRLSEIIRRWLQFNESLRSKSERQASKLALVRFLYRHRDANMALNKWLAVFLQEVLGPALSREPRLSDDKDKVTQLFKVTAPTGPLAGFSVASFGGQGGSPDHLNLTTLHSAKGLEYDVVVMFGMEEGRIPFYSDGALLVREKRRLFYVGLTRARHEVHLLYSGWYQTPWRVFKNGRSRFIDEVEASIT